MHQIQDMLLELYKSDFKTEGIRNKSFLHSQIRYPWMDMFQ